ncbi:hypothetical protein ACUR5C_03715 [Aliikangiella sp. IMCC44653]
MNLNQYCLLLIITTGVFNSHTSNANEFEVRGNIEIQERLFIEEPLFPSQKNSYLSLAAAPEFFWRWNDGNDSLEFIPSARVDQHDSERTHMDIRELGWIHVGDGWESRIGIRRVFWGVTEFQHLVDTINQSDSVEDVDNEDKLGQPMVNLSLVKDWGIFDIYLMPYFRERTFAGREGRPGLPMVNADTPLYESSNEQRHLDWAMRWSHYIGDFEFALSWFDGTERNPLLVPTATPNNNQGFELTPYYFQTQRLGVELQANLESVILKLEAVQHFSSVDDYVAIQAGVEYSQYGIFDSAADLGWLVEYAWDERGSDSTSVFQNDLFFGNRLALNDISSSELLWGLSYDLKNDSTSFLVEASKRLGDSVKVSLDVRLFESDKPSDPAYLFRRGDHIQLTAQYYY